VQADALETRRDARLSLMQRVNSIFPRLTDLANLFDSFRAAAAGKRDQPEVRLFEFHLETNLWAIRAIAPSFARAVDAAIGSSATSRATSPASITAFSWSGSPGASATSACSCCCAR
jgi:hypothetical protein